MQGDSLRRLSQLGLTGRKKKPLRQGKDRTHNVLRVASLRVVRVVLIVGEGGWVHLELLQTDLLLQFTS